MTIFTDKAVSYIPRLQVDLGITREQACGIFGNLGTETGGFTALQEKAPTIAGSRGGYGWMQWTGPRRRKYEAWCKANNLNATVDETNYKYLVQETKTDEAHSLAQLKKTTTLASATETFMRQNLRPGAPHLENRIEWAKKAYAATEGSGAGATAAGGAIIAAGGATVASNPGYEWLWIVVGVAAVIAVIGFALHWINKRKQHEEEAVLKSAKVRTTGARTKGKGRAKSVSKRLVRKSVGTV